MADPLPRHEHGHAAMELELYHFARRRVLVPAQVAEQAACLALLARAVTVADARGALDALVRAHVVDERHEPMVENGKIQAEDLFCARRDRTAVRHSDR